MAENAPAGAEARDRLWTAEDVADYLQASRSWVYMQAAKGTIPCKRVIGLLRFVPDEIRAFAEGKPGKVIKFRQQV